MMVLQQVALTKGHLVLHYTQDHLEIHNKVRTGLNNVTEQTQVIIENTYRTGLLTVIIRLVVALIKLVLYKYLIKR